LQLPWHEKNLPQKNLCIPQFHHPRWDLSPDRGLKKHPTLSLQKLWQKIFRRKLFPELFAKTPPNQFTTFKTSLLRCVFATIGDSFGS
jgi:hypothetical protein